MKHLLIPVPGLLALTTLIGTVAASPSVGDIHVPPSTSEAHLEWRGPGLPLTILAAEHNGDPAAVGGLTELDVTKNPRMSSHVAKLAQAERDAQAEGHGITALNVSGLAPQLQAMAHAGLMRIDGQGRLQAYVLVATTVDEVVGEVERAQGQVQRFDEAAGIVQALVPIGQLEALAHRRSVKFIRLPDYGLPQAGSVTTEGDSILGADVVRSTLAVDGRGVRVGVISDGVGGITASQASSDLPAVDTSTCNVAGSDPTLSGSEGTAMLEIVHDLAPGAELWFGNFWAEGTSLAFNATVDCLAANTDVVVDDISWFNVGPYDGTGAVSDNTSTELNGIGNPIRAYTTAVGNMAPQHYQEPFVDSGFIFPYAGYTWDVHRFQATADTSDGGFGLACAPSVYCWNSMFVADGGLIIIFLQWNDPFGGSNNDYDLFLFDEVGDLVAIGGNPQEGTQDPVEAVGWINDSGQDRWFDVLIGNYLGAAASRTFDMFVICDGCAFLPNDAIHNFNTARSSVPNQSDAGGGVISAGAINAWDPGNDDIAFYSSRGPTNNGQVKPDITGIDGVSITGAGGFPTPFFGTSAAAPHIAGIAALLLECNPELLAGELGDSPSGDRTALRDALLNNAVDLAPAGVDNTYGYGRADALASATAICADSDGDGVFDTIDNCPAWPNASQALPPWPVPADDPDCDGWITASENLIGTNPNLACGITAWPPDFNDDQTVNIFDINIMKPAFFSTGPNPPYQARLDLKPDNNINIFDVNRMKPIFFISCTP